MKKSIERRQSKKPALDLPSNKKNRSARRNSLETLSDMNVGELNTLADAILAPNRQKRLRLLLRKNQVQALNEKESGELDQILEDCDRIALLKAKAQCTLVKSFLRVSPRAPFSVSKNP